MPKSISHLILFLNFFLITKLAFGQGTEPFSQEVNDIQTKYRDAPKGGIVFTGSSSIRLWHSLQEDFPGKQLLNTGFGGSQTHQLLHYLDELVLTYAPTKVFIYEGDNDISASKPLPKILEEFDELIYRLKSAVPTVEIFIISAKPSPSRWHLKADYEKLNVSLRKLSKKNKNVTFVDIWTPMLTKEGKPDPLLFVEDDLHMNAQGYTIWKNTIAKLLK
jgi:lysophospholipase L1-like esterase